MPEYSNLTEAAGSNPAIREILLSEVGHLDAAEQISDGSGFSTTEASVRRWRSANLNRDEGFDDELAEDVESGLDLGDTANVVSPSWDGFKDADRQTLHDKLESTLDAVGADPKNVAGLRVSQYQMVTKDKDGVPEKHDLFSVKLLVKTQELAPAWPLVQQAAPTEIHYARSTPRVRHDKVTVVLPDPQIGYRFFIDNQTFDPFHDEKAMNVALQIVADVQPDYILFLGDFLDLPSFGRYEQEQSFSATTQKSVDRGHRYLAELRAVAANAKISVLEGNHDRRLQNMITNNALAAFGLRQSLDTTGWPVLSVPFLCNFAELGVSYIPGYPAGEYWFNDNLRAIHGTKVRSSGSTASAVVNDARVSTIFGHIHRVETQYITRSDRSGGKTLVAHTPGCLCRIDGAVPSVKGSTDLTGRPVESYENWNQGLSVVRAMEGDGPFAIESLFIDTFRGYQCRVGDKVYTPNI